MSFWKLVAGIVVGNLLTAVLAAFLWQLFLPSMLTRFSSDDETSSNRQFYPYP